MIRRWQPCDSMEAVIGAVADKVITFAKTRGTRVIGHPVTSHPATVDDYVGRAYEDLGLDPRHARVADRTRRLDEIAACDRLVADSGLVARSFVAQGFEPSRITVIRPSLDRRRFFPRAEDELDRTIFRVVCVGIITPRKGQHLLLEAWRRLKLPHAELILVGARGRNADAVVRGYEGSFTHLAYLDQTSLRKLLVRASAFVMPSAEDGFAQAPFEAMACGVPAIVTAQVGMAEIIRSGVDGLVVPAYDCDALMAAIEALHRDRGRAEHMGKAAALTAHSAGSWADYAEKVIDQHRLALRGVSETGQEAA